MSQQSRHLLLTLLACLACALVMTRALGADAQEQLAEAEKTYRQQGPAAALPLFEALAKEFQAAGNRKAEGRAIGFIGDIYWRLGDYDEAMVILEQALKVQSASGDRLQQAKTFNSLGLLHWDLGEFDKAQAYLRQASDIAAELGDNRMAGATLNNLSLVQDELGDYYRSLDQYRQVLELYATVDFPRGEGDTLGNIGGVYLLLGRYQEALEHYQKALAISEQLDSSISMSQDHGNIALAYLGLGQVDTALTHLDRAIDLSAQAGMRQDQAYWLGAKGNALMLKGRYDQGLQFHQSGLAIYEQLEGQTELVSALHDMGRLHLMLGDSSNAAVYFQRAMETAREIGLARGITSNQLALGDIQVRQGNLESALALYAQAGERARESGEVDLWAGALLRQAATLRQAARYAPAHSYAVKAREITGETGAVALQAEAVYAVAEADRLTGDLDIAIDGFEAALTVLENAPDSELAWQAHHGHGLALAEIGHIERAISALEDSIRVIEGVRDHLLQERFRAGYIQDKYQVYVDLVRLQLESGDEAAAFSTAERLRSRSYLDLVDRGLPAGSDDQAQAGEFALKERIRTLRQALAEEQSHSQPEQRQLAISVYSQELLLAEQDYQAFLDNRRRPGDGRTNSIPTYEDVRTALGPNEALVEYVIGADAVVVFLLTADALTSQTVSLRRKDLDNKVELVRSLIRRQDGIRWEKPAKSLAELLLRPILENKQLSGKDHLYLVPHGTLNYLPFALLPGKTDRKVVEDYTLAYLPTAAALLQTRTEPTHSASMLAIAPARSRLQYATEEASAVNQMFGDGSRALIGDAATESAFKREAENYSLLHLATHGYFNKFNPLLSGLELEPDGANDGQLELHEILGLELDADLVTLSACQTGLGSGHFAEIPAGDDFVGLTRAFLYAGSHSVMATLWEVDDASTLDLMKGFYGGLNGDHQAADKALALAMAQRALLASEKYQHPYYWAPFVLVGEMNAGQRAKG